MQYACNRLAEFRLKCVSRWFLVPVPLHSPALHWRMRQDEHTVHKVLASLQAVGDEIPNPRTSCCTLLPFSPKQRARERNENETQSQYMGPGAASNPDYHHYQHEWRGGG